MRSFHLGLLILSALLSRLFAQTPEGIILIKGPGFLQTSATAQESSDAGYGIFVIFPSPVAAATTVRLTGPGGVSINVPRRLPDLFYAEEYFVAEADLERAMPDGSYTVNVSGGGLASSTPIMVPSGAGIRAPLITNFDALQNWSTQPQRIEWEPLAGGTEDDLLTFSVSRVDGTEIFSAPSGSLDGTTTGITIPPLNVAPGETVYGEMTYARLNIGLANFNQTIIGTGRGAFLTFPIRRAPLTRPVITIQPRAQTVVAGSTVAFSVATDGSGLSYQWRRNGVPITGATGATYVLTSAQTVAAGFYTVDVSNSAGSITSESVALTVVGSSTNPGRISNLAIRSQAGTGPELLIVGVAVGGAGTSGSKPLLIRGIGPALAAFGVPGVLADPRLEVYSGSTRILANDNWGGDAQVSTIASELGAFSLGAASGRDAALYSTTFTAPNTYSVQVSGSDAATGVALAEIYDATPRSAFTATTPRLINVSARTRVGTGGDILIAGFVITGETSKTVLIRAIGPTLGIFGVPGTLADPKLEVFQGATLVNTNDNWGGDGTLVVAFNSVGAFPIGGQSRDAALLVTLPPGNYSAQVSGAGGTTGVALVEVYEVP